MLKRLLFAALLAPSIAHAQAEYLFTGGTLAGGIFSTTLMFRSTNTYSSPDITSIFAFRVRAASRVVDACNAVGPFACTLLSLNLGTTSGNVQTQDFIAGGRLFDGGHFFQEDSCAGHCDNRLYSTVGFGVFGCQVPFFPYSGNGPLYVGDYIARTCATDGYDGWFAIPLRFAAPGVADFAMSDSDLSVSFVTRAYAGPSAIVAPEPATLALLAAGLAAVAVSRRRSFARRSSGQRSA